MKLTKAKQKQLDEAYDTLIQVCLYDRPLLDMEPYLAEDVMNFGAGKKEITKTKAAFLKQIKNQKKLAVGLKMDFKFKPVLRKIINKGDGAIYTDDIINTVWVGGIENRLKFRLSFIFEYRQHKWIMVHSHTSTPDPQRSDDEVWPVEELKKRTAVLEKSLDEKIAELEIKNRELEIEAALERVRSRAMGMHKTDELLEAAELVSKELSALGIQSMNISYAFVDEDEKYASYYSLNPVDGKIPPFPFVFPHTETAVMRSILSGWKKQEPFHVIELDEKATLKHQTYIGEHIQKQITKEDIGIPFSVDEFLAISPKRAVIYSFNFANGYLFNIGSVRLTPVQEEMLLRFTKVFEMAYRRFLDIKQALAQAREAQIEAAVEKVRSRSLAMHKSEELQEVVHTVFERLKELNVDFYTAIIILFTEGSKDIIWWLESKANHQYPKMQVPFTPGVYLNDLFAMREKGADLLSKCYSFDEKNELFHHLFENTDFKYVPEKQKQFLLGAEFATMSVALAKNTGIQITSYSKKSFSDQDNQIFKRFTKVFDQAYTRFLDLQKAEAQAREAQIETALERVRSRSMAMQKSEELKDVIQVVYQQFVHLNIKVEHSGFVMDYKERNDYNIWVADPLGVPSQVIIPYFDSVYYNRFNEAKEKGEDFFATNLSFEEKNRFYQKLFEYVPGLTEEAKEFYFSCPGLAASTVLLENIGLYIENFSGTPYTDEENNTLMRFGKVFQQTYTRFLDLQKAEAQAREAQIELGLERVRARAMAMQKSDELKELIGTVSVELTKLDVELDRCFIAIFDPASRSSTWWMASPETPSTPRGLRMKYHEMPPYLAYLAAWEERKLKWQYVLEGAVKKSWDSFIFSETEFSCLPDFVIANMRANEKVFLNASFNSFGCLTLATLAPVSEENFDILLRFAKVFDLTYTRFNDLQKAEAQAREAKIEAALERVRAKAMAMHKSEDLSQAVATVFEELDKLNLGTLRCGIGIINKEKRSADYWVTSVSDQERYVQMAGDETMDSHPLLQGAFQAWLKQEDFSYALKGDDLARYYKAMVDTNFPLPESQFILSGDDLSEQYYHLACFEAGGLFAFRDTPFPEEAKSVMKRFAGVFNLTYKRFLDLQRAEAQAREAQVQLALERVRARTMAMQKSDELLETSQVLYRQLKELGEPADQLTIGIVNEQDRVVEVSATRDDSHLKQIFRHSIDEPVVMNKMYEDWKAGKKSKVMDISGEELRLYNQYRNQLVGSAMFPTTLQEGDRRVLHAAYFSKGMLALATVDPRPEESIQLLERFATVFELTYTRFLDLQKAEAQARESRIEASLERVRSKAMAMHSSQDLADTIGAFYRELQTFSITPRRCGVGLLEKGTRMAELSTMNTTEKGGSIEIVGRLKMEGHPVLEGVYENWLVQKEFHPVLRGNEIKEYYQLLKPQIQFPDYPNDSVQYGYFFYFTEGGVYAWTDKEMAEEELKIYRRFTTVLSLTYKRYKELKEAEAQTRESQIELGLERVRARAMAMQKSDELKELIGTVFTELTKLDLVLTRCVIMIYDTKTSGSTWWMANSEAGSEPMSFFVKYHEKLPYLAYLGAWQERKLKWQYVLEGKDKLDWDDFLFAETELSNLPDFVIAGMRAAERVYLSASFNNFGNLTLASLEPLSPEQSDILLRFAKVFDLTYTRFNDLKQAEAQARESQIQLALERVRARTMGMHKSEELAAVAGLVFNQLTELGVRHLASGFVIFDEKELQGSMWMSYQGEISPKPFEINFEMSPVLVRVYHAWTEGMHFYENKIEGEEFIRHIQLLKKLFGTRIDEVMEKTRQKFLSEGKEIPGQMVMHHTFFKNGSLVLNHFTSIKEQEILNRFAKVFEQTYTRFLDLQKAEAQAREAQIEASLERVRSKTMAMHNSQDVGNTVATLFDQLVHLGVTTNRCGIIIFSNTNKTEVWTAKSNPSGEAALIIGHLDVAIHPLLQGARDAWKNKETFYSYELAGDDIKNYYSAINNDPDYPTRFNLDHLPSREIHSEFYFPEGAVFAFTSGPVTEEAKLIFKRFAGVFGQTYRRYLDLQRAEAQTRQAQIETAMEKVRSRALAMQKPDELVEVAEVLRKEMGLLGVEELETSSIYIHNEASGKTECWFAMKDAGQDKKLLSDHMTIDLNETGVGRQMLAFYHSGQKQVSLVMRGAERKEWIQYCAGHAKVFGSSGFYGRDIPDRTYHLYKFSSGYLGAASPGDISAESWDLLQRATSVFSLAYTRFSDLQQAEASAKEAVKQAALDRVRAEIASMRTTSDLEKITPLIWKELTILGIPFIRCGVFIMDDSQQLIHTFLSTPEGKAIAAFHLPYNTPGNLSQVVRNWQNKKIYTDHWDEEEFIQFADILVKQGTLGSREQYLKTIPHGGFYLHFLPFLQGMLYVGNTTQLGDEDIKLLQSVADAFSTAYARYEDFNKLEAAKQQVDETLTDLKQTQQQLIQAEKMASLGELTAGIAHEIQNPLNFVNNFAQVSNELLAEMVEEVSKGNYEEAKHLAGDVIVNLEKIDYHGKRADAIVKGMLQHSRASSGQKELTDINELAEEYLRLAYHGWRAKDRSFNTKFETDFDANIPKLHVVPQELGRVILNLINNAFYAVSENRKQQQHGYEPTVIVSTKNRNGKVEIEVADNGKGIPPKVLDKIFQPFFTTKPTGEGTGLGLSLSYDIVKAHAGEIRIDTKENVGTAFTVVLPA